MVAQVATRRHLRSAARHQLTIPRHRLSTFGRRAFAVAGPTMFNALPDDLVSLFLNWLVYRVDKNVLRSVHTVLCVHIFSHDSCWIYWVICKILTFICIEMCLAAWHCLNLLGQLTPLRTS